MRKWEKKSVIKEGNEKEKKKKIWKKYERKNERMNDFKKGIVKKDVLQIMRVG